ncbi:MAG: PAS domain S-box protein [Pseudomonadota bacterium]
MLKQIQTIYHTLIFRLTFSVGLVLLGSISIWSYFNINYLKENSFTKTIAEVNRLADTIKLGTHYAMMLNSREDINEIITNIGRQEEIKNIRIYNKQGAIEFSNVKQEIYKTTNIKDDACYICHRTEPPQEALDIMERTRIFDSQSGHRRMGIISPIYNQPGCSSNSCHFHPQDKKVLGLLDVVISLEKTDKAILSYERRIILLAVTIFLASASIISAFLLIFVNRPIKRLITWTRHIGRGEYDYTMDTMWDDEIGDLASAINRMGQRIQEKQKALNRQKDEYQQLFEQVPCYITVHDRDLKLLRYNQQFIREFHPQPGDYCYKVYKGRTEICEICPVLKTFEDGDSHYSEETGIKADGSTSHWLVQTSPIKDADDEIVAVMEMNIDITIRKLLEEEIRRSEAKYRSIFNNIPEPVFVLDAESLEILDCNKSVTAVYGYDKADILQTSFLNLFDEGERDHYLTDLKSLDIINQTRQTTKDGRTVFVDIRISPSEYMGQEAFLITASDITNRLMAEQQLIQAGKMATLGEMATGIAHELNQPLTVIKTASSFLMKKVVNAQKIRDEILLTMAEEIDSHVDRASKIINHLREFGRKAEVRKTRVDVNGSLNRALEMFSQQLKLRKIEVIKNLDPNLPHVLADPNRLEQIFVNLLINARDAIEERWEKNAGAKEPKQICLKTGVRKGKVTIAVTDNGSGIPDHVRARIFEPFFTTKTVGKGTGLGLSISYGIVQDYDGTITLNSEENKGSEFVIQFPLLKEDLQ